MRDWRVSIFHTMVACAGLACLFAVHAEILIGQTSGFSGASAASVTESTEGARTYLDAINARGGINGHRINLQSLDDAADNARAATNARTLIDRGALALFLTRGTPQTEAIMPLLEQHRVPLVAPSTGAMLLHEPVRRYVFNVRSTYQREAEKAIHLLKSIGIQSIAVIHVDDAFGRDALAGAQKGFDGTGLRPVVVAKFDKAKPDFAPIAETLVRLSPQAIIGFGSGATIADAIKVIRARGVRAQLVTLSNNSATGFVKALGEHAIGTIVTQVFPNERSITNPMVKEALAMSREKYPVGVSPAFLEGFAAAKVLVEGLRRAGQSPTPERLRISLEGIRNFDLGGGLTINYSERNHTGLDYVDLSIVSRDGKFSR